MKRYYKAVSIGLVASMLASNAALAASVTKDETVYVNMKADGEIEQIIVSDWLHSDVAKAKVADLTKLTNVKNIDTNEKANISNGKVDWNLEKGDLYYQGESQEKLPVEVKITYWYKGQEIEPEDLVGKSGAVRMKIDYVNNMKKEGLYVPFSVVTAMTLANENFKNVKVSGAEVINEGLNQVITGIHFPGMKQNLPEVADKLALNQSIEVTAVAENFQMMPIVFTVASKVPDVDLDINSDSFGEIKDKVDVLKDATQKLSDAASKIQAGQTELKDKETILKDSAQKLNAAVSEIEKGSASLAKGTEDLYKGLQQYFEGTKKLIEGTTQFGAAAGQLSGKIKEVSDKTSQLSDAMVTYSTQMEQGISGLNQLTEGSKQLEKGMTDLSAALGQIEKQVSGSANMGKDLESLKAIKSEFDSKLAGTAQAVASMQAAKQGEIDQLTAMVKDIEKKQSAMSKEKQVAEWSMLEGQRQFAQEMIKNCKKELEGINQFAKESKAMTDKYKENSKTMNDILAKAEQSAKGGQALSEALKKVSAGSQQLSEKGKTFTAGMEKLNAGMGKGKDAAAQIKVNASKLSEAGKLLVENSLKLDASGQALKKGSEQVGTETVAKILMGAENLFTGAQKLNQGIALYGTNMGKYAEGMNKLDGGIDTLKEGVTEYASKMGEFNGEVQGIGLDGAADIPDIQNMKNKIETMRDIAEDYNNYSGLGEDMDGQVKFVMKTAELKPKKVEVAKNDDVKKEKPSFFEWLTGLFS